MELSPHCAPRKRSCAREVATFRLMHPAANSSPLSPRKAFARESRYLGPFCSSVLVLRVLVAIVRDGFN